MGWLAGWLHGTNLKVGLCCGEVRVEIGGGLS